MTHEETSLVRFNQLDAECMAWREKFRTRVRVGCAEFTRRNKDRRWKPIKIGTIEEVAGNRSTGFGGNDNENVCNMVLVRSVKDDAPLFVRSKSARPNKGSPRNVFGRISERDISPIDPLVAAERKLLRQIDIGKKRRRRRGRRNGIK